MKITRGNVDPIEPPQSRVKIVVIPRYGFLYEIHGIPSGVVLREKLSLCEALDVCREQKWRVEP